MLHYIKTMAAKILKFSNFLQFENYFINYPCNLPEKTLATPLGGRKPQADTR